MDENPSRLDPIVERFRRTLERGRLATTYLFIGPVGAGKLWFANLLAGRLLCQQADHQAVAACGVCQSCLLLAAGSHPDLLHVAKPADKSSLPIALLIGEKERRGREGLCHDLGLRPAISTRRVAVIEDADAMKEESANCLLKTLEEPPPRSVLLLIAENEARVLPTIRSRSQVVRFPDPASADEPAAANESPQVEEVLNAVRSGLGREPLDPVLLGRALEPLMRAGGSKADDTSSDADAPTTQSAAQASAKKKRASGRDLLRVAVDEVIRLQHAELMRLAARNEHRTPAGDAIYRRLERSMVAAEEVERNANPGTLLQAYLQDLAELA
ncbi:DNA polymerase III subunit tau [Pirellulimonas nuda]|uniref:DNA polymerase III subunit tau n=1 Tax=Pirellulimonas nuda TaxID=2528009 RepID=A0A518DBE2_9BACT|nr:DNA polymerase III subunit [Pirellulimonas nuda]QDU88790.1 DNA polymerase III subunit tau [Pirellulimonas nuda]